MIENVDLMGLRLATEKNLPEDRIQYVDLAQGLLERSNDKTLVQEFMQFDGLEPDQKKERVRYLNNSIAKELVVLHNNLLSLGNHFRRMGGDVPTVIAEGIFDKENPQAHYESIIARGLSALSPEQARIAGDALEREQRAKVLQQQLEAISRKEIADAIQRKDVATYFKWRDEGMGITVSDIIETSLSRFASADPFPDVSQFENLIKSENSHNWEAEAKAFNRLRGMLNGIPLDPLKPRVAIMRLPKEVNPRRDVRVLIDFPPNTFKNYGGYYSDTDPKRNVLYAGVDTAACVLDAYNRLYILTREEVTPGNFVPRPFYLTPYDAMAVDSLEIPDEAQHILEISFHNSPQVIPPLRAEMQEKIPGLVYAQKTAIDEKDLQVQYGDDGLAHLIIGRDEDGLPIRQSIVPYAVKGLMNGIINALNIPVVEFM